MEDLFFLRCHFRQRPLFRRCMGLLAIQIQFFHNIVCLFYEFGALFYQTMRTGTLERGNATGYGIDFSALVGCQFPLASDAWTRDGSPRPGILYACDLVGAFCGAIAVSVILVPALGILATCLLVVFLKAISLTLVAARPASG